MSFNKRTYREIVEATLEELTDNSQITDTNIGSVSRTLIESVAREISNLYDQMEAAYDAGFIETAHGKSLDMVVGILGLERKSAQYATGTVTFSRRNPSEAVTVPRGTRVATVASTATNVKLFETTRTVEIPISETEVEAPIKALIPGEEGIADFETIAAIEVPIIGIDKVLNKKPTTIGTSRESDEELRARARSFIRAVGKATPDALKATVLEIPGVRGVAINEIPNDIPGEIDIIIDGLDLSTEDTLDYKKVTNAIEAVRPAGICVNVRPTSSTRLDLRLYMKLNEDSRSDEELDNITIKLKELVTHYIKSLCIGENLVRNKIISTLFEMPEVYNIDNLIITTRKFEPRIGGLIEDTYQRLDPQTQDLKVGEYERLELDNIAIFTQYSLQASSYVYVDINISTIPKSKTVSIQKLRDHIQAILQTHFDKLEGGEDIDYIRIRNLLANIEEVSEIQDFTISAFHEDTGLIIKDSKDNIKTQEHEATRIRDITLNVE